MSHTGIRTLSMEERSLVSGGAQTETTNLPPIDATLPPDDNWYPHPPNFSDPWGPGDGGGGGGGGGGDDVGGGGDGSPDITFIDVKPFESKLTYVPGENGGVGFNQAVLTYPITDQYGQWTVRTELQFNTDGTFKDGKGTMDFVANDGSLLKWELQQGSWQSTINGGYYWDIGGGFGFQVNVTYNTANNDIKGEAQFLYNKNP